MTKKEAKKLVYNCVVKIRVMFVLGIQVFFSIDVCQLVENRDSKWIILSIFYGEFCA